jgi:hypothetical protein
MAQETITRAAFIKNMMNDGVPYQMAVKAFNSMMSTVESGVCSGHRIAFGRIGALNPVKLDSRTVTMGFDRTGGEMKRVSRVFVVGSRIKYKFTLFRAFTNTRSLRWQI